MARVGVAQDGTSPLCNPADPNEVRLQVSVTGMRSTDGNVAITIYPDDPVHFLDGAYKVARQQVPVSLPVTHACFVVTAPGYYAVALFHDDNNSGHFDTTSLGLPPRAMDSPTIRRCFRPARSPPRPLQRRARRQSGLGSAKY